MTNLTLHIENNATLEALLPLLKHLGIHYSSNETQVAEPTAAYQIAPKRTKKRLEDSVLPKPKNINWQEVEKIIAEGLGEDFDTEAMLAYVAESRKDRILTL
jgi:hypothetical protein